MAKSSVTIKGERELVAALERVAERAVSAGDEATEESAEAFAADMRSRAPVDTGTLVGGIGVEDAGDGTREVGVRDVAHAPYVEFGTSRSPAQPYATPAAEVARSQHAARVAAKLGQVR